MKLLSIHQHRQETFRSTVHMLLKFIFVVVKQGWANTQKSISIKNWLWRWDEEQTFLIAPKKPANLKCNLNPEISFGYTLVIWNCSTWGTEKKNIKSRIENLPRRGRNLVEIWPYISSTFSSSRKSKLTALVIFCDICWGRGSGRLEPRAPLWLHQNNTIGVGPMKKIEKS